MPCTASVIYFKMNFLFFRAAYMIMTKPTYRNIQNVLLLVSIFVLAIALYFEYGKGLQPCPLCLMQRLCTFLFGLFCLIGLRLTAVQRARRLVVFQMIFTACGVYFAGRQVWLQSLPMDQAPACMPSLDMLVHYFSKTQVLTALFWGSGDCAEVSWRFWGLSIPAWSVIYFIALFLVSGFMFCSLSRHEGFESK